MGKSITPTFRVEMKLLGSAPVVCSWPTKHVGRPSDTTLAQYVRDFENSTMPGGVNEHLGAEFVDSAVVIRQATGEVVATYTQEWEPTGVIQEESPDPDWMNP
jgi:hypothetical protein